MEDNFIQGGCVITWKIENCNFYKNSYVSPKFYLENSQETEWCLLISYQFCSFTCYLDPINIQVKTAVCFDVCISSNENSVENSGVKMFPTEVNFYLASLSLEDMNPLGSLLVQIRLRNISDFSFSQYHFYFRTVEEVESRNVVYDVSLYHVLFENRNCFFRVFPVCQRSIPLEVKLWGSSERDVKLLNMDIIQYSEIEEFGFFCKVLAEDLEGNLIVSNTKTYSFGEEVELEDIEREEMESEESVELGEEVELDEEELVKGGEEISKCSLKIPFYEEDLNFLASSDYRIKLKCQFCTTFNKRLSWIEDSAFIGEENGGKIGKRNSEGEKSIARNDFLRFYEEGKHTDLVLSIQGRQFLVHKAILRARSPVFADRIEKESNLIEIADLKVETLEQMVYFMYSDTLQTEDYKEILKLYEAALKYQALTLKDKCLMVLKRKLNDHNASELLISAHSQGDTEFQNDIEKFIFARGKKVFQTEEWKTLMKDEPSLGCKILYKFCSTNI